jgi:predicted PurR-regulated permease PerM
VDRAPTEPERADQPAADVLRVELGTRTVIVALGAVTALVLFLGLAASAPGELTLLAIGGFLGLALDPVTQATVRATRLPWRWAAALVLLLLTVAVVVFAAVVAPQLADQTAALPRQVPEVVNSLTSLPLVGDQLAENDVPAKVEDFLGSVPERIAGSTSEIGDVAGTIGAGAVQTMIVLVVAVALVVDGPSTVARLRRMIPAENRQHADELGRVTYAVLAKYFVGNLLQAAAHGVWVAVWGVALGVPLTPVLAVWATITAMIPQIGGFLGGVLIVAVSLSQGLTVAIVMGVAFFVYMTFSNNVVLPVLVGRAVDVSAPVTMLGAIAGFAVAGVPGSLLAIPVIGAAKALALQLRGEFHPDTASIDEPERLALAERWRRLESHLLGRHGSDP